MNSLPINVCNFIREICLSNDVPRELREQALNLLTSDLATRGNNRILTDALGNTICMLSLEQYVKIQALVRDTEHKLLAIKELRAAVSGLGLKEAKDAVENLLNWNLA